MAHDLTHIASLDLALAQGHLDGDKLHAYVTRTLEARSRSAVKSHLRKCVMCRAHAERLRMDLSAYAPGGATAHVARAASTSDLAVRYGSLLGTVVGVLAVGVWYLVRTLWA